LEKIIVTTDDRPPTNNQKLLDAFGESILKDQEIIANQNKNTASKLVWYVAISGFAFLNIKTYLEALLGKNVAPINIIIISVPWVLSAMVAVVSHWMLDELNGRLANYFMVKRNAVYSGIAKINENSKYEEVQNILRVDTKIKQVSASWNSVSDLFVWAVRIERASFILLLVSFGWSFIYPLMLLR
jgi:hypothetical protein